MNQVIDFFKDFFTTALWPPRWHCGYWSDFHGWLYIISDLMIWFAYFAIPVIILSYIYKKKYQLKYTNTYVLFASFILLCGSTHLLDAAMFWAPMYKLSALVKFITGIVSLFTVYHLVKMLPEVFREKTSVVLQSEIAKRIEMEKKLAEANKGLEAFAFMASHDLKEPLRKIRLYADQLFEVNAKMIDDQSLDWLKKTISGADRMERIINDILNLSSIQEKVEFTNVSLHDVINQALVDLEVKINKSGAEIIVDDLPAVYGSQEYLILLFTNIINNAIKFTNQKPIVKISSAEVDNDIAISITDNGIGMKPEDTSKIFQAFQRLHSRKAFEGSGIGLAICKKIIDVHQGSISVVSELEKGTTFIIQLRKGN